MAFIANTHEGVHTVSSRLTATLIVGFVLCVAGVSYCGYGVWNRERLLRLPTGTTQQQVRSVVGVADTEREVTNTELGCADSRAATIWTYRINDAHGVELVFDQSGKLICKTEYFITI